jgi:diacylglycerol kinase (ATP)
MKTRFIFNPTSGRNRRRPALAQGIREFIATHTLDADFVVTEGPGHATELARDAVRRGCSSVVAVGGDGTMNEVAQALLHTPTALALVPCGSGNGLALHLGLPRTALGALRLASGIGGRTGSIDTGAANGRPFFNAMGLGLDADVSHRFNRLTSRGLPAYVRTAWAAIRHLRHERCTVWTHDRREVLDILLLAVANSDQYGNNARIAPGARVDDGALDLVAVRPVNLLAAAGIAVRLFLGNVGASRHVTRLRGQRFIVDRAAPGLIHTDGETHETGARVEITVAPRSLRVLVPAASRAVAVTEAFAPSRLALQTP